MTTPVDRLRHLGVDVPPPVERRLRVGTSRCSREPVPSSMDAVTVLPAELRGRIWLAADEHGEPRLQVLGPVDEALRTELREHGAALLAELLSCEDGAA